uniref:Hemoglobin subunit beta-1 n=1 Tax=Triturus cristatus TaxID=8323 RepID=HBB1_TRICR|nr:RecName: Full=Hemoglobin subunit beta-1; AltName: Full=Beta-1-globin; AltName: Full=Hemoglobin beta-1 chain; AltName: Full=Hemoglobin beta-major chain [Triturus cristatus]
TFTNDESQHIHDVCGKIPVDQVGAEALGRLILVNPWTRRYFKSFGDLSSAEAIQHNPKVASHGAKVMHSIAEAVKHLDDLKAYYADLSTIHCKKLYVDPANFKLFGGIVSIVTGMHLGTDYTAQKQAAFEKFLHHVEAALATGYH